MELETRFCGECLRDTLHIEGECVNCSIRKDVELHEKLKEDEEEIERMRMESLRRPK